MTNPHISSDLCDRLSAPAPVPPLTAKQVCLVKLLKASFASGTQEEQE